MAQSPVISDECPKRIPGLSLALIAAVLAACVPIAMVNDTPARDVSLALCYAVFNLLLPGFLFALLCVNRTVPNAVLASIGLVCSISLGVLSYFIALLPLSGIWAAFSPCICYLLLLLHKVRKQIAKYFYVIDVQILCLPGESIVLGIISLLFIFFALRFCPYRTNGSVAFDMHLLGYANQIAALHYGFPLKFISIAGEDFYHGYNTIGQMLGVVFQKISGISAIEYTCKIHYLIISIFLFIAALATTANFAVKQMRLSLYALLLLAALLCNMYPPQFCALPFVLISAILLAHFGSESTWGALLIGWTGVLLVGMRVFAIIPLGCGLCYLFGRDFVNKALDSRRILRYVLVGALFMAGVYIFMKYRVTVSAGHMFEDRCGHVYQLFSDVRGSFRMVRHIEGICAGLPPFLISFLMSTLCLVYLPLHIAKILGLSLLFALVCAFGATTGRETLRPRLLAAMALGPFFAIAPLDLGGMSQVYTLQYAIIFNFICYATFLKKFIRISPADAVHIMPKNSFQSGSYHLFRYVNDHAMARLIIFICLAIPLTTSNFHNIKRILNFSDHYYVSSFAGIAQPTSLQELQAYTFIRSNIPQDAILVVPEYFRPDDPKQRFSSWKITGLSERKAYVEHTWDIFPDRMEANRRINILDMMLASGKIPAELQRNNIYFIFTKSIFRKIVTGNLKVLYENSLWTVARYEH